MKSKITQALVERGPTPERGKSVLHADTEMRGFYLIVTPTKRSFYVQSLVNGKQVRTKLGDHPSMDAKQARDLARKTLVEMRGGANPNEERRKAKARGITLRDALDLHLAAKPLSPRTKDDYRYCCDQYLPDWLDKALAEIGTDRAGVRERHRRITEKHGASTADTVFRSLGARRVFEHRKEDRLPLRCEGVGDRWAAHVCSPKNGLRSYRVVLMRAGTPSFFQAHQRLGGPWPSNRRSGGEAARIVGLAREGLGAAGQARSTTAIPFLKGLFKSRLRADFAFTF